MKILNVGPHPIDLADGRSLGPGESADVDSVDPGTQSYVDRGRALVIEDETPKQPAEGDEKTQRSSASKREDK